MSGKLIKICNRIIEYSFYLLFFLVPLIFTPWNFELFEFNKMILTYLLTIIIVASFLLKSIMQKEMRIARTPLDIPILLFLASLLISTAYSIDPHTSIWGYYSRSNGGLASMISYIALYYVFVSTFVQARGDASSKGGDWDEGDELLFDPDVKSGELTRERRRSADRYMVKRLLLVSLASGLVVTLWGLPSHFGFDPTCLLFQGRFDTSCWTDQFKPEIRIFSTLGQPNWLAAYLSILIPLSIVLGLTSLTSQKTSNTKMEDGRWKMEKFKKFLPSTFYLLLSILFYLALLFTNSRSGFAGLGIGLLFFIGIYIFIQKIERTKRSLKFLILNSKFLILFLVFIGSITFFVSTPFEQINKFTLQGIRSRLLMTNDQRPTTKPQGPALEAGGTESGEIRKVVWQGAIDIARHYPLFGSGVETFAYSYYKFRPIEHNLTSEWDFLYNKAHNEYLNYAATTGFVGLGTYLLMIGVVLLSTFRYLTSKIYHLKSWNKSSMLDSRYYIILALASAYLSILISNFFGFSVVITNLYLFLIPGFVFVLNGTISPQKVLSLRIPDLPVTRLRKSIIYNLSSMQLLAFFSILLITSYFLLNIFRFWLADAQYSDGYSLDRAGQYPSAYRPLLNSLVLRPNEPTFQAELAFNNAMLATFFGSDATSSAQLVKNATYISDLIVKEHPNNVSFWKDRARIFYALSDIDETHIKDAISSLEKAKELAPTDAKIGYNLAVLYSQHDRTDEAIKTLTETIKLKPDYRDAYFALGLFYNEKGDRQRAIEQMEFILTKIASDDADARERLSVWRGY